MLRWTLVLALIGCDMGPIQEHRIRYEKGGLSSSGPEVSTIDVDLRNRTLAGIHPRSPRDIVVRRVVELEPAQVKLIGDLASCARDEPKGPQPHVTDAYEKLTLDGDQRKSIEQPGPMTAPCAAKLEATLEMLAGWRD